MNLIELMIVCICQHWKICKFIYLGVEAKVFINFFFRSETTTRFSGNFDKKQNKTETKKKQKIDDEIRYIETPSPLISGLKVPAGVIDFDRENWNDPYQVSHYAMDIFQYLKERETTFLISDYMERQVNLSKWMRSLLVDWMVEVQESFELNHETLYLAVKVVDLFLGKITVSKERLQLLGAAALFIACKFDVSFFHYILFFSKNGDIEPLNLKLFCVPLKLFDSLKTCS